MSENKSEFSLILSNDHQRTRRGLAHQGMIVVNEDVMGDLAPHIRAFWKPSRPKDFLFYAESPKDRRELLEQMTRNLRETDPELESRSIRHGALKLMARNGVPTQILLSFSGHSSAAMLKNYLDDARLLMAEARPQRTEAGNLLACGRTGALSRTSA